MKNSTFVKKKKKRKDGRHGICVLAVADMSCYLTYLLYITILLAIFKAGRVRTALVSRITTGTCKNSCQLQTANASTAVKVFIDIKGKV
uniref:Uncharacterized protein n=1 Tax=Pyxicephalus adspersus TaxID=30357 RepID=A0AAV3BA81_PYXAD|nr:TPA: hypothetical protein GDO54_000507 [Pyxicephalus adspersus]